LTLIQAWKRTVLSDGTLTSVWGDDIYNTFANGMDRLAMFSSKPGVGEPAIFTMNANGALDYEVGKHPGLRRLWDSFLYGDGFKPETMMGIILTAGLVTNLRTSWISIAISTS
jgi:hypothetical protein